MSSTYNTTDNPPPPPTPVTSLIDAYSPTSVLSSPATVPLGTTVVLVCRVGGVASGTQLSYTWTCPNGPCDVGEGNNPNRKTYGDRMVLNVLTSRDGGTYTCLVREGQDNVDESSFTLRVQGEWHTINLLYLCMYAIGEGRGSMAHLLWNVNTSTCTHTHTLPEPLTSFPVLLIISSTQHSVQLSNLTAKLPPHRYTHAHNPLLPRWDCPQ